LSARDTCATVWMRNNRKRPPLEVRVHRERRESQRGTRRSTDRITASSRPCAAW
jgi:hypothetical protein